MIKGPQFTSGRSELEVLRMEILEESYACHRNSFYQDLLLKIEFKKAFRMTCAVINIRTREHIWGILLNSCSSYKTFLGVGTL